MSESTQLASKIKLHKPSMWTVVFVNDDFTPMDFVIYVLMTVFHKSKEEAANLMLAIHNRGQQSVGRFTKEVAGNKANIVLAMAAYNQHPLHVFCERIDE